MDNNVEAVDETVVVQIVNCNYLLPKAHNLPKLNLLFNPSWFQKQKANYSEEELQEQ